MVTHVHTRIPVHVKLVHGRSGQTGPVVQSHVGQVLEFRLELELEMKNVPKRVPRLRIVMDQEMSAVEPVTPGRHGQLAHQHVMVELNQEVEHVAQVHVRTPHKIDHATTMLCAVAHVPNGVNGVVVVSLVMEVDRGHDLEHVVQILYARFQLKLTHVTTLVTCAVMIVPNGLIGQHVMSRVVLVIRVVLDNVVQIAVVLYQPSSKLVTLMSHAQVTVQFVKIGPNGLIAVHHVALELKHVLSHVVIQVAPIIQRAEHVTPMSRVRQTVARVKTGVTGLVAVSLVDQVIGHVLSHVVPLGQIVLIIPKVKLAILVSRAQATVQFVKTGLNGLIAVYHVALELKHVLSLVAISVAPTIQRVEHVTPMSRARKYAPLVPHGVNGVLAMSHVGQEQNQEPELVLVLLQTANKKPNKRHVTLVPIVLSIVTLIVTLGAHGLLALLHVMAVPRRETVFAHSPLKVFVSRRKIKTAVRRPVHQIPVHLVLVKMASGLNGDSALKHVAAEFKTDFECCVARTAIPKNK